ncbi:aldehyde dehydrogenase family protein [Rhodococcus sp. 14-2483-1-2]|jgi:aldehyde dehydrogenase (NAD+)|uniref:aldehyde dehydrogenase family protein n=1 Tax=Rhodococcus sp. 14-2483-1-2 TaxID=2023147 RepID=UPI000B9B5DB4|nr:aldehyde dehydrogenase family protein [Rhodococcus sp. 14-2483-1-2]OZF37042.1 aldehyde dehydrogenase family protein [Rhodococcus sp. 14-2483-1-2]
MTTTETREMSSPALERRVQALRAVHASGRTRPIEWRLKQLEGIVRLVTEREADVAAALAKDLGRSPVETWLGDLTSTKGEAEYAIKHLRRWMKPERVRLPLNQLPGSAWVQDEPLGVVLVIGPWNYPVYLTLGPLIAAVAAGNCAVVKPSELAPATSALLATLLPQYVDPDAVIVVEGDGATTQELLALGFDHALFTGGTEVGRKIMAAAAPTLTPVTLELGGKSPAIVTADADLDVVARRIAWVKLLNSGQTCISPDYVLVDEKVRDRLVEKLVATVAQFRSDQVGGQRIVNKRQFDRLAGYIAETKGRIVTGGGVDEGALTIEPTIIVDPDVAEPAMSDEIFGPILPVVGYRTTEDAIAFVNRRPKPLGLYIFSSSKKAARDMTDRIPAGGVVINHVALHCLVAALPFGGVGASGMGAYHGEWGFHTLSHRKSVLSKTLKPDIRVIYPPYTERAKKIMRRIF